MRSLNLDPRITERVHHALGETLWHLQLFEEVLIHYITIVFKLSPGVAETEGLAVLERTGKQTLGALLKELKKYESLSPGVEQRLQAFLEERNWFVHRSRRENHTDLYSHPAATNLLNRLDVLGNEALALSKEFQQLLVAYGKDNGIVTQEMLDKAVDKVLKDWGAI